MNKSMIYLLVNIIVCALFFLYAPSVFSVYYLIKNNFALFLNLILVRYFCYIFNAKVNSQYTQNKKYSYENQIFNSTIKIFRIIMYIIIVIMLYNTFESLFDSRRLIDTLNLITLIIGMKYFINSLRDISDKIMVYLVKGE